MTRVLPDSPAERGGLQRGDVITRVDDTPVTSPDDLNKALAKKDLSKGIALQVTNSTSMRSVFIKSNMK